MSIRLVAKSVWNNPGNHGKRGEKALGAIAWQVEKRTIRSTKVIRLANGILFKAHPDCVVSSSLIYADWPEYHELMFLRRNLRRNDVLIDVGAYVGHVSLLLADLVQPDNIFAFEPTPVSFRRLVDNWVLNGWETKNLFQSAVGSEPGTVWVPNVSSPIPTNSITLNQVGAVEAPLLRLDDQRQLWASKDVGLLKVDVEGYELNVLSGSRLLLKKDRPRFVMFESLEKSLNDEIASLFSQADYLVFQLNSEGKPDFRRHTAQNLFAIPSEHRESVEA